MQFSRRSLLSLLGGLPLAGISAAEVGGAKRVLRIAYFSDIHLPNDAVITERAALAFEKAKTADLFLFGGDNLMAIDGKDEATIAGQFSNWKSLLQAHLKKPYLSILGNHDIEQWPSDRSDPLAGKERTIDLFKMKSRYWSSVQSGWRIIGLDAVQKNEKGFKGHIDKEQLDWLKGELRDDKLPTLILSHMPILTVTALGSAGMSVKDNTFQLKVGSQIDNARPLIEAFQSNGNIKAALSGHTHMVDRCDFKGTSYICAGAVCGNWWNGANDGFPPAYTQIDLFSDGTFQNKLIEWEA